MKFAKTGGEWRYAVYDDGNGNGVRNQEIVSGTDPMIRRPRRVLEVTRRAVVGLPGVKIVDPDGDPLPPGKTPVQFNSSTLASFSPLGTATPGTIYLTDDAGDAYAVRVYGATGKITLLRYDWTTKTWVARW